MLCVAYKRSACVLWLELGTNSMEISPPLTSPDCDLRDFAFMPLDVVRLRDSDLAALESPDACWAAVLLWCASWHQIPAASLPNDDRILANLAGFGRVVKEWQKVRSGALRGWIECSDGRLYHPVIAEKANDSFTRKLEQSWRTECARIKKFNQRHADEKDHLTFPSLEEFLSQRQFLNVPKDIKKSPAVVPKESPSNREGEGQGQRDTEVIGSGSSSESSTLLAGSQTAPPVNPNSETKLTAGEVCKRLVELRVAHVNPGHVLLSTLLEAGATMEEFAGVAQDAVSKGKGKFAYVLNTVKGQREDAKIAAEQIARGELKTAVSDKPVSAIANKICEVCRRQANVNTSMGWRCTEHISTRVRVAA